MIDPLINIDSAYARLWDEEEKKSHLSESVEDEEITYENTFRPGFLTEAPEYLSYEHHSCVTVFFSNISRRLLTLVTWPFGGLIDTVKKSPFLMYHTLYFLGILTEYTIGIITLFLIWEIIRTTTIRMYESGSFSLEVIDQIIVSVYWTGSFAMAGIYTLLLPLLASREDFTLIVRILAFVFCCFIIGREDEFIEVSPFCRGWQLYLGYIVFYIIPSIVFSLFGAIGSWNAIPADKVKTLTPVVCGTQLLLFNYSIGPLISAVYQTTQLLLNDNTYVPYRMRWPQDYYEDEPYGLWRPFGLKNYWLFSSMTMVAIILAVIALKHTSLRLTPLKFFQTTNQGIMKGFQLLFIEMCRLFLCPWNLFNETEPANAFYFCIAVAMLTVTPCAMVAVWYDHSVDSKLNVAERVSNRTKFFVDFFVHATALCVTTSFWRAVDLLINNKTPLPSLQHPFPAYGLRFQTKVFAYPLLILMWFWMAKLIRTQRRELVKAYPVFEIIEEELNLNCDLEGIVSNLMEETSDKGEQTPLDLY